MGAQGAHGAGRREEGGGGGAGCRGGGAGGAQPQSQPTPSFMTSADEEGGLAFLGTFLSLSVRYI